MAQFLGTMRKQISMLKNIMLMVHFDKILAMYLVVYFAVSLIVWYFDPDIKDLSDALWFTFETVTTIGYGDLLVNSDIGRILTVFLSIYSIALVAIFTGLIAGFYMEMVKMKSRGAASEFLFDLQRLPEMSHEELVEMSERARKFMKERSGRPCPSDP